MDWTERVADGAEGAQHLSPACEGTEAADWTGSVDDGDKRAEHLLPASEDTEPKEAQLTAISV